MSFHGSTPGGKAATLYQTWGKERIEKFRENLLRWFKKNSRRLPWRTRPTPYRVWISEIMLQQTQVRTVLPYYRRFMDRFPDVESLARAGEEEVLAHWAGLGYYRRARDLHRAAKMVMRDFGGNIPDGIEDLLRLPGIGRYTAGAIGSIAFRRPYAVVDGNIRRLITRVLAIDRREREELYWKVASEWLPEHSPSEFNQAVMELGALVCTKSKPRCSTCPVESMCEARRRDIQELIPRPRRRREGQRVELVVLILETKGTLLLVRKSKAAFIPGEWGLPSQVVPTGGNPERAARRLARKILRIEVPLEERMPVRHAITHRRIHCHVFAAEVQESLTVPARRTDAGWFSRRESGSLLTSSIYKKALRSG